ncbi:hypothetical protein CEXT_231421 [Caerostris extrusa]|uniref:Uncharacterized protein n=1 Tax=Caerostris extrusa TaxID=172846 RepID=A0AAV4WGK5_CAEEX|nr:hypothetical protein CEXT_231421 [Caerostris extrusa]
MLSSMNFLKLVIQNRDKTVLRLLHSPDVSAEHELGVFSSFVIFNSAVTTTVSFILRNVILQGFKRTSTHAHLQTQLLSLLTQNGELYV